MTTTQTPAAGRVGGSPCPAAGLTPGDLAALRARQPVISACDGACVCGAEDGLFADPDPSCGVAAHRHAALYPHLYPSIPNLEGAR